MLKLLVDFAVLVLATVAVKYSVMSLYVDDDGTGQWGYVKCVLIYYENGDSDMLIIPNEYFGSEIMFKEIESMEQRRLQKDSK